MLKQIEITRREWSFFAIRWVIPISLLLSLLGQVDISDQAFFMTFLAGIAAIITNLIALIFLMSDKWSRFLLLLFTVIDTITILTVITIVGPMFSWLGIVPVVFAGLFYGWVPGLAVGLMIAAAVVGVQFIEPVDLPDTAMLDIEGLIMSILVLPAVGPIISFLTSDEAEKRALEKQVQSRTQRAENIEKFAHAYMEVIKELTAVLSASRLEPRRVLSAAVSFSLESLERIGVKPPLYGAVLLFDDADEDDLHSVLRVAQSSMSVPLADKQVAVPGVAGVINETLERNEVGLCETPATDSELKAFESFGGCGTVACMPLRAGSESYGVILIGSPEKNAFTSIHVDMMYTISNQAAASLNNARLYSDLLRQRDKLVAVEKNARAQLASDLHDGPTQGVAAITMRLNFIRKLLDKKPERALEELYNIEDVARRTTAEIRHMLFALRPKALENGLGSGLEQLAEKMKDTYNQNVQSIVIGEVDKLMDDQATQTFFSVALETLNNARKHSEADLITVELAARDDNLVMEIIDNGKGFDVAQALEAAKSREGHLGLINLQERAALVEGHLQIISAPGEGTRTLVSIPLDVVRRRKADEDRKLQEEAALQAAETAV